MYRNGIIWATFWRHFWQLDFFHIFVMVPPFNIDLPCTY
jgi:hypothetical protein